tara:strand:+ start:76 stop:930 length:855 start_codon:yes stop_codon:yes gene_type:complete
MKVLVTGGSGLAGFPIVRHLVDIGCEVISIDKNPLPKDVTEYKIIDCENGRDLFDAAKDIDVIIHLAAIPRPANHDPGTVFRTNIMSTFNVFETAATTGVGRIIYISSVSVLGVPFFYNPVQFKYFPIDEDHPNSPQDSYALSKMLGEEIADGYIRRCESKLSVVSLRLPWIHTPETFKQELVPLWDDPFEASMNLWSYIDTRDVAKACELAIYTQINGHEPIFISAGNTFMNIDTNVLLDRFYPSVNRNKKFNKKQSVIDISKATNMLGFEPNHSWENYRWNC